MTAKLWGFVRLMAYELLIIENYFHYLQDIISI
jgi:hypothetical protein